jgi:hypothetical protein
MAVLVNRDYHCAAIAVRGRFAASGVLCYALSALLLLWSYVAIAETDNRSVGEYDLKAVYLYSFAQFIKWPEETFRDKQDRIVIGILGQDPFENRIDDIVKAETVQGRPLSVQRFNQVTEVKKCHILFISESFKDEWAGIFKAIQGQSILTVSEVEGFAEKGGIINFVRVDNKIRFEINGKAVKRNNLEISSRLLKLSIIVKEK